MSNRDETAEVPRKKRWIAPALDKVSMVDTALKPGGMSEGSPAGMPMATGSQSIS
jgi:hypothetical protein